MPGSSAHGDRAAAQNVVLNGMRLNDVAQQGSDPTCLNLSMMLGAMAVNSRNPTQAPFGSFSQIVRNLRSAMFAETERDVRLGTNAEQDRALVVLRRVRRDSGVKRADFRWVAQTFQSIFRTNNVGAGVRHMNWALHPQATR